MKKISRDLQGILWSKKIDTIDLGKDKNYVIHQVLAYGSLKQVKWLFQVFPERNQALLKKFDKEVLAR